MASRCVNLGCAIRAAGEFGSLAPMASVGSRGLSGLVERIGSRWLLCDLRSSRGSENPISLRFSACRGKQHSGQRTFFLIATTVTGCPPQKCSYSPYCKAMLPDDFAHQRMEAVNRLAAGVAHEFNNVLQIVRGYVAFARDSLPEGSETRQDLDNALEATDRASNLSTRLLQFARAEDEQGAATDANDAVDALRMLLRPIIGENVRLTCETQKNLPCVAAGDASLRQALLNLCVNARDAMAPEGGGLHLSTALVSAVEGTAADVGALESTEYVRVSVSDSGQGVPPEIRSKLFEPFFTTKAPGEGTGLGLPMVATFVKSAGGAIVVDSEPGVGTRFDLYFRPAPEVIEGDWLPESQRDTLEELAAAAVGGGDG